MIELACRKAKGQFYIATNPLIRSATDEENNVRLMSWGKEKRQTKSVNVNKTGNKKVSGERQSHGTAQ